jgi:hypothetical protein
MTPQEKAKYLVEKFSKILHRHDKRLAISFNISLLSKKIIENDDHNGKKIAIEFVNEMLDNTGHIWGGRKKGKSARDNYREYWNEVKEHINNI